MNVSRCFAYSVSIFLGSQGSLSASELLMSAFTKECVRKSSRAQFTCVKAMFPHPPLITVKRWYTDSKNLQQLQKIKLGLDEVKRALENIAYNQEAVTTIQGNSKNAFPSLIEGRVSRQEPTFLPVESALAPDGVMPPKASKLRPDYVQAIILKSRAPHEVNHDDLIKVLDVFTALAHRSLEGISRVLSGVVDIGKSKIYCDVLAYLSNSRDQLATYRQMYAQLNQLFDEPLTEVIAKVSNTWNDHPKMTIPYANNVNARIAYIIESAHPLYPVESNEVREIMKLYSALQHRPTAGVSRVLSGEVDIGKSKIYSDVLSYLSNSRDQLTAYRYIYARLCHSRINDIINYIVETNNYIVGGKNELQQASNVSEPAAEPQDIQIAEQNDDTQQLCSKQYSPENLFESEIQRLKRLYSLLPQYHGNMMAGALGGEKTLQSLPIYRDLNVAINQIQKEAEASGDTTKIDLNYFRNLYSKHLVDSSGNRIAIGRNTYQISQTELHRLKTLYKLLHNYHGNSIKGALSGETSNMSLPIWRSIDAAINQIREEAKASGDPTEIDLNYFRRVYWSAVRVLGKKFSVS